jgi:hypothetical protein
MEALIDLSYCIITPCILMGASLLPQAAKGRVLLSCNLWKYDNEGAPTSSIGQYRQADSALCGILAEYQFLAYEI